MDCPFVICPGQVFFLSITNIHTIISLFCSDGIFWIAVKYKLIIIGIATSGTLSLMGQGEIDTQKRVMFRDESTVGVFFNSNGLGVNYRYGFWRDARNQFILDGDLTYVKHPKEVKSTVAYEYQTHRYVYGKQNLFWEIRGAAGWQKELYRKIDKNGISVRLFYDGGISLGFLKPIYYEVYTFSSIGEPQSKEDMKFDTHFDQRQIGGRSPFLMGFDELKVLPGLTGKAGFSFEYSQKDAIVHALEAAISLTAYPREVPIMATEKNRFLFLNLMVGYRFGNIVNISEAARAKTWKEKREERKKMRSTMPYPPF